MVKNHSHCRCQIGASMEHGGIPGIPGSQRLESDYAGGNVSPYHIGLCGVLEAGNDKPHKINLAKANQRNEKETKTMEQQNKVLQSTIHLGTHGENYGTWMSHPVFYMIGGFALAALILAVLSFAVFHITALGVVFLIALIALIAFIGWMEWIRRQYAFGGGGRLKHCNRSTIPEKGHTKPSPP